MLRNHRFHAVCALGVALALAGLPGCGGSDKTGDYKKAALKAGEDFKDSAQSASLKVKSAPDKAGKLEGLEALKASVNSAADDFADLEPPDKAKAANDQLVTELRALAGDVDAVKQALRTDDKAAAQAAIPRLQADEARISTTIADLEKQLK